MGDRHSTDMNKYHEQLFIKKLLHPVSAHEGNVRTMPPGVLSDQTEILMKDKPLGSKSLF